MNGRYSWVRYALVMIVVVTLGIAGFSLTIRLTRPRTGCDPIFDLDKDGDCDSCGLLVTCVDRRIDTEAILGCHGRRWYIYRAPGPVMSEVLAETILFLARDKHVTKVVFLGHTDCGAVALASSPDSKEYSVIQERMRLQAAQMKRLEDDPRLAPLVANGRLRFEHACLDVGRGVVQHH